MRGKILCRKPLLYLGSISFSVYGWHLAIIQVVEAHSLLSAGINAWIALTATLLAASITYFTIESPCMNIVNNRHHIPL
jgi:peptidoglycan/LPS O-acetylase OafA/YrhL